MSITTNPSLIADSLCYRLSKTDTDIFHRMMRVDMQIACRFDFQIECTMFGEKSKHVIQETNTRLQL